MQLSNYSEAYYAGNSKYKSKCVLYITEGDSASGLIDAGLDNEQIKYVGCYRLTGKIINVLTHKPEKIGENKHFINLKNVIGLRQDQVQDPD